MLSQGIFHQKVVHIDGMKVSESTGLHMGTRHTAVIIENGFLLMSKQRSQREPIISFLKSVPGFKSTFSTHKKCDGDLLVCTAVSFPSFRYYPKRCPLKILSRSILSKLASSQNFILTPCIFPPGSCNLQLPRCGLVECLVYLHC